MSNPTKGLGKYQRNMIKFIDEHDAIYGRPSRYSITRDRESRGIAISLEKRGLITINRDFECWTIRRATKC